MNEQASITSSESPNKGEKHMLEPEHILSTNHTNKRPNLSTSPSHTASSNDCENQTEELFNGVPVSKLTKTQMKKYQRMLRWQASKKEKRAKERLKTKDKKIKAKLLNIDLGPSRKQLKNSKMANSSCKIGVAIDLSFDDLMINKVKKFLIK